MSDEGSKKRRDEDAELEREVRSGREYSLAEAIGRAAGDLMKGASPVSRRRQAEIEIAQYLEGHLADAEGALSVVLLRRVRESADLLEASYTQPLETLTVVVERLLASNARLRAFVRRVDAEWGRIYSERPMFELGQAPPRPGDPYTLASVRETLSRLLERLRGDAEG